MKSAILILIPPVVILLGMLACGGDDPTHAPSPTPKNHSDEIVSLLVGVYGSIPVGGRIVR